MTKLPSLITPATSTTQDFALKFKNCHKDFGSQKSKLTQLEQVFQTAGVINPPPPIWDRVKYLSKNFIKLSMKGLYQNPQDEQIPVL